MNDAPSKKRLPVRWLSLAEIVGVAALVIAGLGYWDNHRERIQADREHAQADRDRARADAEKARQRQAEAQESALKHSFLMTGATDSGGARIKLQTARPEQVIQTQTLWFPTEIKADSVSTTGNPRLESRWIEDGLRKYVKGETGRVPVGIETTFIEDGQTRTDRAVYMAGFSLHGRPVGGPRLEFEGLSLARRGVTGDPQAAANGYWIGRR
jgi:hypothetical protein